MDDDLDAARDPRVVSFKMEPDFSYLTDVLKGQRLDDVLKRYHLPQLDKKALILPNQGELYFVADLHGNLRDFHDFMRTMVTKIVAAYADSTGKQSAPYIVLLGDYLDGLQIKQANGNYVPAYPDQSLELLTEILYFRKMLGDRFIPLMGDHDAKEFMPGLNLAKAGQTITPITAGLPHDKQLYMQGELAKFPLLVRTQNGFAFCHTGPAHMLRSWKALEDLVLEEPKDGDIETWRNTTVTGSLLFGHTHVVTVGKETRPLRIYREDETEQFAQTIGVEKFIEGHSGIASFEYESNGEVIQLRSGIQTDVFEKSRRRIVAVTVEGPGWDKPRPADGRNTYGKYFAADLSQPLGGKPHGKLFVAELGESKMKAHPLDPTYELRSRVTDEIDEVLRGAIFTRKALSSRFYERFVKKKGRIEQLSQEDKQKLLQAIKGIKTEGMSDLLSDNTQLSSSGIDPSFHWIFSEES